jgi:hypothetical protein
MPLGLLALRPHLSACLLMKCCSVNVEIQVFNNIDSHPSRRFTLSEPLYQIKVGRGSQNGGKELLPAEQNAWFESRVMSRAHAILQADPIARVRPC